MSAVEQEHKSHLCVGGSWAGKKVASPHSTFMVVEPVNTPAAYNVLKAAAGENPWALDQMVETKETEYREQRFHTDGEVFVVWVPRNQSSYTTMRLLLQTYEEYCRGL